MATGLVRRLVTLHAKRDFVASNKKAALTAAFGECQGGAAQRTPSSSTSNFNVALGGITPPAPRAP